MPFKVEASLKGGKKVLYLKIIKTKEESEDKYEFLVL